MQPLLIALINTKPPATSESCRSRSPASLAPFEVLTLRVIVTDVRAIGQGDPFDSSSTTTRRPGPAARHRIDGGWVVRARVASGRHSRRTGWLAKAQRPGVGPGDTDLGK